MTKKFTRTVPVHAPSESWDSPDYAVIELDTAAIKRIKQLARAVKDLKVAYIEEFDNTADLKTGDPDNLTDWGRSECNMLKVSEEDFHYNGILKHTDITWETEGIPLKDLPRTR